MYVETICVNLRGLTMFEFLILIGIMWFIFALVVAKDAMKEGKNARSWFFIVLIFGIFGVAAYAISLSSDPSYQPTLRVKADVIDRNTNNKSRKALNVSAPSARAAENRFIKECSKNGYDVISQSINIQEKSHKTANSEIPENGNETPTTTKDRFRPGKSLLPDGRIKSWYENTHLEIIIFSVILSTILASILILFIIYNLMSLVRFIS